MSERDYICTCGWPASDHGKGERVTDHEPRNANFTASTDALRELVDALEPVMGSLAYYLPKFEGPAGEARRGDLTAALLRAREALR